LPYSYYIVANDTTAGSADFSDAGYELAFDRKRFDSGAMAESGERRGRDHL
jgi:hypothetical protein